MAGAFVGEAGEKAGPGTGTGTVTVTATANNLLVAILSLKDNVGSGVTDGTGNWIILQEHDAGANGSGGALLYRVASGNSNDNFNASWTNSVLYAVTVAEYSGLDATSPYETSNENATYAAQNARNSALTIPGGAVSPTTQPGLAVAGFHSSDERDNSVSELSDASGGFTQDCEAGNTGAVPIAFAYSRTYSDTSSRECEWDSSAPGTTWQGYGTIATFKEPAAGGTWPHALLGHPLTGPLGGPV
jgi:hypothetical protein